MKKILKGFQKNKKLTTNTEKKELNTDSFERAEKILKEEKDKLNDIKNKLNKNLENLYNTKSFF